MYKITAEKAKNNVFLQILAKKAKKSDFFLDIFFKSTIIRRWTSKLRSFSEMFERNPLAVKSSSSTGIGNSEPSGGGDSIADNFDVCNWRPDSETVASRAFAHASSEKFKSWGVIILSYWRSDIGRDRLGLTSIFFYLYFCGIWPGRCNSPLMGF